MKLFNLFLLALLVSLVVPVSADVLVRVDAGDVDRAMAPVYADVKLEGLSANPYVSVSAGNQTYPAQIEALDNGQTRVWWIVQDLAAGESREYRIGKVKVEADEVFAWDRDTTSTIDLAFQGRGVLRYMYPQYNKNEIEYTKKPFHHVFAPSGKYALTKGVGGKYSHHRGIFVGYNKCNVDGERYDIWHARNGEHSQHEAFTALYEGPVMGGHTVQIHWNDKEGKPFIEETRTLRAFRQTEDAWLIEIDTTLESVRGDIRLDGDRQHAGVQFRSAQEVAEHQGATRYLRPQEWKDLPAAKQINSDEHVDLPWNAIQIDVQGEDFTVAYLTDPQNPDGARFSERLYGRFGEFIPYDLTEEKPLHLRYRWWVCEGHDITREEIQTKYEDFANPMNVQVKEN